MRSRVGITRLATMALVCLMALGTNGAEKLKKEKLQVVLLFGQSNMVGLSDVKTAWYLTQPQYIPSRENALSKSEIFDWNSLYWQGVRIFDGPPEMKTQLLKLVDDPLARPVIELIASGKQVFEDGGDE